RALLALALALAASPLLSAPPVPAGARQEVAAATGQWAETLRLNDPEKIARLCAADSVLWGTLSPTVRADPAAVRDYFVTAFEVLPGLEVSFGEQHIRVYGDAAVNTGYYTFSYRRYGETKTLPARYSFTFVKAKDGWVIVDHHSSAMPAAPR
ncbi:MAG: nuclear transport factor 2 family protein, partial [Steroidobacteraceae bacterium]